jgi:hypothetical protein
MGEQKCATRTFINGPEEGGVDEGIGSYTTNRYRRKYRNRKIIFINLDKTGRGN